jgi:transketolase
VQLCVDAAATLKAEGVSARVVSFPSWDLFALQDPSYRESVLPSGVPKVAIEAGSTFGWERYVDSAIGIDHFGASAPGDVVLEEFGITAEALVERAKTVISSAKK